jgi:hypothetical protein
MRYGLAAAAVIAIFATAVGVSFGATGPNVCNATGATTAVGIKIFGADARASNGFNVYGWCQIVYGNQDGVYVYLEPKSQLQAVLEVAGASSHPKVALKGLGPGAVAVMNDHIPEVVFTVGAYAVEIQDSGGVPTEKEFAALALVVHAHLVKAPSDLCSQGTGMCVT